MRKRVLWVWTVLVLAVCIRPLPAQTIRQTGATPEIVLPQPRLFIPVSGFPGLFSFPLFGTNGVGAVGAGGFWMVIGRYNVEETVNFTCSPGDEGMFTWAGCAHYTEINPGKQMACICGWIRVDRTTCMQNPAAWAKLELIAWGGIQYLWVPGTPSFGPWLDYTGYYQYNFDLDLYPSVWTPPSPSSKMQIWSSPQTDVPQLDFSRLAECPPSIYLLNPVDHHWEIDQNSYGWTPNHLGHIVCGVSAILEVKAGGGTLPQWARVNYSGNPLYCHLQREIHPVYGE